MDRARHNPAEGPALDEAYPNSRRVDEGRCVLFGDQRLSVVTGWIRWVSRFRLYPTRSQHVLLLEQCGHATYVWNLGPTPGFVPQCRQLTDARAAFTWLRAGSQTVQQQALRDFDQAVRNFYAGQTCSVCGHCAPENRESQAVFQCVACGHQADADVNAAINITAGRAVSARGETQVPVSLKREPQPAASA